MSKQSESHFHLSLPITDMAELLAYEAGMWGTFRKDNDGMIGSIHPNEIPRLAHSFIIGCMRAIKGGEFAKRAGDRGVTADINSLKMYEILSGAFAAEPNVGDSIYYAMQAFEALADPDLRGDLDPECAVAAKKLVSYLYQHVAQLSVNERLSS